ncbi:hypothetical protein [Roseovarius indicus]|uniref:Uncharacterized protein n=1 Tax=Roseovarius indicus TaxID=540747 RepID=A0A0T5P8L6_9RHOB|nr:hypothetical protein [Roseovarius indicus]KRS17542.1 hypothetical protein XM52_13790 [Roseovarius indicus]QEW26749.1 hypothetical protein RIdsm_02551 [Roseovarius indicus]SFD60685.1 hypothetical protein SAMN04488031_101792 [Roseovarius indicus]
MNWVLIASNMTSVSLSLVCWWLAHLYGRCKPPGRSIAGCYALVGFTVLLTMLVRNLGVDLRPVVPWLIVITKTVLTVTFLLVIVRRYKLGDR